MQNENARDTAAAPLSAFTKAVQEKPWAECGIEEKVERLRRELLDQQEISEYTARTASRAAQTATNHQHNHATGEVLQSVNRGGGAMEAGGHRRNLLK